MHNKLSRFWLELKRRKVLYFLLGYVAACFAIIEFFDITSDRFIIPDRAFTLLYVLAGIGLPFVIILPWIINRSRPLGTTDEPGPNGPVSKPDKRVIPEKSIVVLPFENISPDPDQEYFSDGLTEEIITDLSYIHDLLVISRSSAMTFKGTKKTLKEVTDEVGVKYALEGSVRKAGNNIRIVAQLIDGTNDSHIWADKYNGVLDDIFDIQERVSRSIADALEIKLSSQEKEKINHRPIDNAFAYDCYKRAYPEFNSMTKERIDFGLSVLHKGLEVTGENALIYAGIGAAYNQYVNNGFEAEENLTKAEEYLEKALKLEPELPEAHFVLGMISYFKDGGAYGAIDHWKRAYKSNPDDPEIMIWLALLYSFVGQNEAALQLVNKISRIDPINPYCDAVTGWVHFFSGMFETAVDPLFAAYKLAPESVMHQFWKALILLYNAQANKAYDLIDEVVDESSTNIWTLLTLFLKNTIKKDKENIALLLTSEFVSQIQIDSQSSFHLAAFYSYVDEKEESLKWLENAVNRGFINYPLINEQDILLGNIRDEEAFKLLMKRVKKEWENFKI